MANRAKNKTEMRAVLALLEDRSGELCSAHGYTLSNWPRDAQQEYAQIVVKSETLWWALGEREKGYLLTIVR